MRDGTELREKVLKIVAETDDLNIRKLIDFTIAVALEEAARVADDWEIVRRLLPLCDQNENECARVGQIEAQERIAAAIRALITSKEET
jgi:hypothetical protein